MIYRFGLIGCGRISAQHLKAIQDLPNAELVAVCDVIADRAKAAAGTSGAAVYTDAKQLIARDDIDIVSICTPNGLHLPLGIEVLTHGKHILLEKPVGLTVKQVDTLTATARDMNKKVFAVLQVRFNPPIQYIKRMIDEGYFGKVSHAALVIRWTRPQAYFDQDAWRGTKAMDGGGLLSQGIHYLDVMQWFFGPVRSVFAKASTIGHERIEVEDLAVAVIEFESGVYATVEFTTCTYPRNLECSITILGSKGTVKLGGAAVNEIDLWEVENLPKPILPASIAPNIYAGGLYQGSCPNHIFVYKNMLEALDTNTPDFVDATEARKSVELIQAMYESARDGKQVQLPLSV